jgi:hypothetical protein
VSVPTNEEPGSVDRARRNHTQKHQPRDPS